MNFHLPTMPLPGGLGTAGRSSRLTAFDGFGSNPGQLAAWAYVPKGADLVTDLPLVVVLHGCTQSAAGYDRGSGWSELAEAYGFAVLFPEQTRANNPQSCFNWFEPGDTQRGKGEALSIAQMVDAMAQRHGIDRARVFITGLSAGGAMTSVMLATYPDIFAGGAILAGLPHGAAASVQEALSQMRTHSPTSRTTGTSIRRASPHAGKWPSVAIWHGTADAVVSPSNADAIAAQWRDVHGLSAAPTIEDKVDGYPHRAWHGADGSIALEDYRVVGMGHGAPQATGGECGCGEAGAFMLEAGISSTVQSAKSWGLLGKRRIAKLVRETPSVAASRPSKRPAAAMPAASGVGQVIEDALRAAGLMK